MFEDNTAVIRYDCEIGLARAVLHFHFGGLLRLPGGLWLALAIHRSQSDRQSHMGFVFLGEHRCAFRGAMEIEGGSYVMCVFKGAPVTRQARESELETRDRKVNPVPVVRDTDMVTAGLEELGDDDDDMQGSPHSRSWRLCWETWR